MISKKYKGNEIDKMNTTELKEVFELLKHENIHLSEDNTHIAFVGKYILTNIDLLRGIKSEKTLIYMNTFIILGSSSRVPVTSFRFLAGLKPLNKQITRLDLSFCQLGKLVAADESMKV